MSTKNALEVSVGKPVAGPSGPIYAAPIGTTLPTDAAETLDKDFVGLGYVSDAGWSENMDRETSEIKEWGGVVVLRPQTGFSLTVSFALIQTNEDVMKLVYGPGNVTESSGAMTVLKNDKELPRQRFVIETLLSDGRIKRTVIPNGQITEVGEIQHTSGDAISYQLTVTCFPDSSGDCAIDFYAAVASGETEG